MVTIKEVGDFLQKHGIHEGWMGMNIAISLDLIEQPLACSAGHRGENYSASSKQGLNRSSKNIVFAENMVFVYSTFFFGVKKRVVQNTGLTQKHCFCSIQTMN